MNKQINDAKFLYIVCLMVFVVLLANAATSFSAPFPENINKVIRLLSVSNEDNSSLHKTTQGQIPAYQSPGSMVPIEYMEGLREVITQRWNDSINGWRDSERDVVTSNERGDIVKVTSYNLLKSTQTWEPDYEVDFTYNAKGKASSQTFKDYLNGKWVMGSLLSVEYNEVDSPASFLSTRWDTVQNDWDSISAISGEILYASDGKLDRIIAYRSNRFPFVFTYTYLPDGRLNEEASGYDAIPGFLSDTTEKTRHYYPDALSEILLSHNALVGRDTAGKTMRNWENNDSAVIRYNPAGIVIDSKRYFWTLHIWKFLDREITTYDAKNRPLVRLTLSLNLNDTADTTLGGMRKSKQLIFNYENQQARNQVLGYAFRPGIISGSMLSKRTVALKGFPEGCTGALIEFYDLKGVKVYAAKVLPNNGGINLRLNRDFAKGFYSCRIQQGDRMQTLGITSAW